MAHGPIPDKPEHDAESLALEEQFGIPSISLDFGDEGRAVVSFDTRKMQREMLALSATFDRASRQARRVLPRRPSINEAAAMTQDEFDRLAEAVEELGKDSPPPSQ